MFRRFFLLFVMLMILLGAACPPQVLPPGSENPVAPRAWSHDGSDKEGSGFNAVHSTFALAPLRAWSAPVGELAFSGPVVGPDGAIYVGTITGDLVALNPDGTERFRRNLDQSIFTSPAVNTETGDIFVIGERVVNNNFESRLFHLNSTAALLAVSSEPFASAAAPKLWRNFVFVPSGRQLLVFDQASLNLVARVGPIGCISLVCGTFPDDLNLGQAIFSELLCIASLGTTHLLDIAHCCCAFSRSDGAARPVEPSVAIVDAPSLIGDPNKPMVIIVNNQCATAIRFHPNGDAPPEGVPPIDQHFSIVWNHALVPEDCDFDTVLNSSPAAVLGGQVIIGDEDGRVLSLDLLTGEELWQQNVGGPIANAPVAFFRQIYVVTDTKMVMLDSNGDILDESPLRGNGHAAALSLDFAYVTTSEGVHTFNLDPAEGFAFDGSIVNDTHLGTTKPAMGKDGTLYVSVPNGFVHAFASQGVLARPVEIPSVSWASPLDGATIAAVPAEPLSVALAAADGGDFEGTVSLMSSVDGALCSTEAQGLTASCTTDVALSPGTHTFTAFAEAAGGGTNTAEITVHVVSASPVVTITAPLESDIFNDITTITFTATVDDSDEPNFPSDQVVWTSSLDGELGTGLSIQSTLSVGTHTITATATDSNGVTGEDSVEITIFIN